jgi:hypothetical protein
MAQEVGLQLSKHEAPSSKHQYCSQEEEEEEEEEEKLFSVQI